MRNPFHLFDVFYVRVLHVSGFSSNLLPCMNETKKKVNWYFELNQESIQIKIRATSTELKTSYEYFPSRVPFWPYPALWRPFMAEMLLNWCRIDNKLQFCWLDFMKSNCCKRIQQQPNYENSSLLPILYALCILFR